VGTHIILGSLMLMGASCSWQYTEVENREVNRRLLKDLGNMSPRPTDILHRWAHSHIL
jgi:hypothetical protein